MSKAGKPLEDLQILARTHFKPDLRPPRRVNDPIPPSLAESKLPPPCAEVDERPSWRYRRFRLWREAVVPLRVAVVDRNRRVHLRRYQAYAIPANPTITKGSFAYRWTPPPTPHPSRPASPAADQIVPHQGPSPEAPAFQSVNKPLPLGPPKGPTSPLKLSKAERKARRLRLLQFQYALDQEHERRFRRAMRSLVPGLVEFEARGMTKAISNGPRQWEEDVDLDLVIVRTQLFRDIRKKSNNVFDYVDRTEHPPVPRRAEIHEAVRKQEQERKAKKSNKQEQGQQRQRQPVVSPVTPQPPDPTSPPTVSASATSSIPQARLPQRKKQTLTVTDSSKPDSGAKKPSRRPPTPASRRSRHSPESPGDLTDGTTASEASVRTPTSSRPRTLVPSKSAPVATLSAASSIDPVSPATPLERRRYKEIKEKKHRLKRQHTTPAQLDTSLARKVNHTSDPETPFNTGDLQLVDQEQLLKDLQRLLAKLSMNPPDSSASGSEVTNSLGTRTTFPSAVHFVEQSQPDSGEKSTKDKHHRGRLVIIRSKSGKAIPSRDGAVDDPLHHRREFERGNGLPVSEDTSGTPAISSDRSARLAELEERVEAAMVPAKEASAKSPASLSTSSVPLQIPWSPYDLQAPTSLTLDSSTEPSQASFTPAFGELNMDEDTAAPFIFTSQASSVSPSGIWKSGSELDSGWSDSLDGGTMQVVSVQDTARLAEGSIDTAVPAMRHKEVFESV